MRRELVTPSVRTQQCSRSRDQRRCATCAMRAALAVCERFQHESSSPCYRSSGGWVECSRLSESAASCGATSSADTTSSSPGSRYRAREARRSSGCLRCLLLVMCTYLFAKKVLTLHLARGEGRERYFGCNLMQHKVLASSYQHLMAEAPIYGLFQKGRVLAQDGVQRDTGGARQLNRSSPSCLKQAGSANRLLPRAARLGWQWELE